MMEQYECIPERVLVTGGAGFIGSHLVDFLLHIGRKVTVLDNLSNANKRWLGHVLEAKAITFIEGDVAEEADVHKAVKGQQQVWHLAGNADIPLGYINTQIDLDSAVYGTRNILEAMKTEGIKEIIFTSSGAVYGAMAQGEIHEGSGPLYPLSMYAAGKVAAEAFISSYGNLFGINGWIFRFGNVLGSRMSRGVIRDFATRLLKEPTELTILGDGTQAKSYFLVNECIEGMVWVLSNVRLEKERVEIFNLGNPKVTSVVEIAKIVSKHMGLSEVQFKYTHKEAWPGDQPIVRLNVSKVAKLGWAPRTDSDQAVAVAAQKMIEYLREEHI